MLNRNQPLETHASTGRTHFQDDQLQFRDIIWVHPILCRRAHKVLLSAASRAVPFDRNSLVSNQIVELRQLDDKGIVVVLEEWFRF